MRNVTDRVPDALASVVAKRMWAAYRHPDPLIAQAELEALARELDRSHHGAAAWPEVLARIDAEQGHRPGLEVAVYLCAPLQVLQPAGSPPALAPAT